MLVYRICKKEELDLILNDKSFKNIGEVLEKDNKKYIRLFKDKASIFYFDTTKNLFICTYDIPKSLLEKYFRTNFYPNRHNDRILEKVSEYLIENDLINFKYLLRVERILDYIDIGDYVYGDISSKIKTIYLNEEILSRLVNENSCDEILTLYSLLMSFEKEYPIGLNLDVLIKLIPEIKEMIGFLHKHPHHHLDVWNHTLYALSMANKDFDLRLSLLLHDVGKPFSYREIDGVRHFYNHPIVSEKMSRKILTRIGFNDEYIDKICYLVRFHDTRIDNIDIDNYDLIYTLYQMQECDALAHHPLKLEKRKQYLEEVKRLYLKKDW